MKRRIVVNAKRCTGCKACELACALAHSGLAGIAELALSGRKPGYRLHVKTAGKHAKPVICRHCIAAPCVKACAAGALGRKSPDEPVLLDEQKCVGTAGCVEACPFHVLIMNRETGKVLKCDLCVERLARGLEPACAEACPPGALVFVSSGG